MMANRKQPIKTTSHKYGSDETRHFPHLKPLSVYSRMVFCKAASSCSVGPSWSPDGPFLNLKVELTNSKASVGHKRRLDDSCLDETYDSPPKRLCLDKCPSSDLACLVDSFETSRQVKLVSTQSSSIVLDEIKRVEKTLSDHVSLGLGWIDAGDESDGQSSAPLTNVHSSSPVIVYNEDNVNVVEFDYDVDEIMCLSPIETADVSADGLEDFIQSCQTYEEHLPAEQGHSLWCSSRQKQGKSQFSLGTQNGSDEGYVTKSYYTVDSGESKVSLENELTKSDETDFIKSYQITIPNLSNNKTPPVSNPIMSTPLNKFRQLVKRCPPLRCKLELDKEIWSSPIMAEPVKASSSISPSAFGNLDTGNTEALAKIPFLNVVVSEESNVVCEGTSIHKSLVCHDQEKLTANEVKEDEDVDVDLLSVSQQLKDSEIEMIFSEETDATDSFESTLPLQVQVKSKVVLPNNQQPEAVKATAHHQPEKKPSSEDQINVFRDIPRPVALYREEDWEKEKKAYVDSVMRHMTDNMDDGVMTELLNLMNNVANQSVGSDGRKWRHPSDLTRRNYRLHNSNRLLSLDEWQNLNYRNHRRFAKVPQMFKRSPML